MAIALSDICRCGHSYLDSKYKVNSSLGSIPDSSALRGISKQLIRTDSLEIIKNYIKKDSTYSLSEYTKTLDTILDSISDWTPYRNYINSGAKSDINSNIPSSGRQNAYISNIEKYLYDKIFNTLSSKLIEKKNGGGGTNPSDNNTDTSTEMKDKGSTVDINELLSGSEDIEEFTDEEWEELGYDNYNSNVKWSQDPSEVKISLLRSVFGMPYQFLPDTDRRLYSNSNPNLVGEYENMGRKYIERIAQRANIVFITPGTVQFLKGASKNKKSSLFKALISGNESSAIENALLNDNESYKYYSFSFAVEDYWYYLNPMIRSAARYLNLGYANLDGKGEQKLDEVNYYELFGKAGGLNNVFFSKAFGAITFYADNMNSSSHSISTQLGQSSFAESTLKSGSETAQEIGFLMGKAFTDLTNSDWVNKIADEESFQNSFKRVDEFISKYLNNNSFAKRLGLGALTIATGGQIIFPQIWRDTSFDADPVNITVKLTSPDNDDFSIWWNILIPMYAAICLAAPHGNPGIDGYSQPFLVRAFCQSMFNIECGYVTSLSINLGGEGYWTKSGLPTALDITMTIQDVYDTRYISSGEKNFSLNPFKNVGTALKKTQFLKNTTMLNWIACSCGVNLNKPDVLRDIDMYLIQAVKNPIVDKMTNLNLVIQEYVKDHLDDTIVGFLSIFSR